MIRGLAILALACALETSAAAQPIYHGQLSVLRAGRGEINLDTGRANFKIRGWELLPKDTSNGIDPASEAIAIGIADEKFLIPAGNMKVSRNKKKFRYKAATDRGIQLLTLVRTSTGTFRMTLKVAGVDLSTLVITDPPLCLSFAVIIGDDDGFSGVWFNRPKPFPSRLLTLPGFCTDPGDWPWL